MKQLHVFTVFGTAKIFFDGQFKYLSDHGNEIHIISSKDGFIDGFCERNNVIFTPMEITRKISLKDDVKVICSLVKYIKKNHIEVVFGHTPKGALLAMIASFIAGIKHRIYYRHGLVYTTSGGLKRFILKAEERAVSILSSRIINVSRSLSRLAIKDHLNDASKQSVIGMGTCGGIDAINKFNPSLIMQDKRNEIKDQLHINGNCFVFGFCGRSCNDKGTPELVDAFELFQKLHSDIHSKLLLIGRLDERDILKEATRKQIENNPDIILTGFVEGPLIAYYYSLIDVFVFPSHREGFGMCVLEASAMEKPILVSRSHGCEDSIVEGVTGYYIPLESKGICVGMELMLDDSLRNKLGKNGRELVVSNYDFRVMWPMINELHNKIIEK